MNLSTIFLITLLDLVLASGAFFVGRNSAEVVHANMIQYQIYYTQDGEAQYVIANINNQTKVIQLYDSSSNVIKEWHYDKEIK